LGIVVVVVVVVAIAVAVLLLLLMAWLLLLLMSTFARSRASESESARERKRKREREKKATKHTKLNYLSVSLRAGISAMTKKALNIPHTVCQVIVVTNQKSPKNNILLKKNLFCFSSFFHILFWFLEQVRKENK